MSSYTVGLDFGTHQTKICIEDATIKTQKMYEFFEFETLEGANTVLFPSIVQINKDDTVTYGFVDENKCKEQKDKVLKRIKNPEPAEFVPPLKPIIKNEPKLTIPDKPELENPIEPKLEKSIEPQLENPIKPDFKTSIPPPILKNLIEPNKQNSIYAVTLPNNLETELYNLENFIKKNAGNIRNMKRWELEYYNRNMDRLKWLKNEKQRLIDIHYRSKLEIWRREKESEEKRYNDAYKIWQQQKLLEEQQFDKKWEQIKKLAEERNETKLKDLEKEKDLKKQRYELEFRRWKEEKKTAIERYNAKLKKWEQEIELNKIYYEEELKKWKEEKELAELIWEREKLFAKQEHEKVLEKWKDENSIEVNQKQIFRYFKLAAFSNQQWDYSIPPKIISVWYLTFILFKLEEKFGNNFFTQMGVPCSLNTQDTEKQISIAYKILISANELIKKYTNINNFLKAKYTDLLQNTKLTMQFAEQVDYKDQNFINEYGINILPEAFAALSSITKQGKFGIGFHLLADIGGGTTDIAFFAIIDKLPNIHAVISFPQGLNYIFEEYLKENDSLSIPEVQQLFNYNQAEFNESISNYHRHLRNRTKELIKIIEIVFSKKLNEGYSEDDLKNAMKYKPIVYSGGGSMYENMRIELSNFKDIRLIDKELIGIPYIKNKNIDKQLFTILATSYGLSIQFVSEIIMIPFENIFDHLPKRKPIMPPTNVFDYYDHVNK